VTRSRRNASSATSGVISYGQDELSAGRVISRGSNPFARTVNHFYFQRSSFDFS